MYNVGKIENGIMYNGYVNFKFLGKNNEYTPIVKNAGTKFLRDLICEALSGYIDVDAKLPRYMNLKYEYEHRSSSSTILSSGSIPMIERPVPIDTRVVGKLAGSTETESVLLLKSLMSYTDLLITESLNFDNNTFGTDGSRVVITKVNLLLEDSFGNVLAEISDVWSDSLGDWTSKNIIGLYKGILGNNSTTTSQTSDDLIEGDRGVDAMIEWRLVFRNGEYLVNDGQEDVDQ